MNHSKNALLTVGRRLMTPKRTFFARRSPWGLVDVSKQMADMERSFARMEREVNAAFRDLGFGREGSPFGLQSAQSFYEPTSSGVNRLFPMIEGEFSVGEHGGKYVIKVDVGKDFNPEGIKMTLKDRMLTIEAKSEHKSEDGTSRVYQEVARTFTLPENLKIEDVKSQYTPDGFLLIEAPMPEMEAPKPKEIPIAVESK